MDTVYRKEIAINNEDALSNDSIDIENVQKLPLSSFLKQRLLNYQISEKEKMQNAAFKFILIKLALILVVFGLLYLKPEYFIEERLDTNMFTIESVNQNAINQTILLKAKGTLQINSLLFFPQKNCLCLNEILNLQKFVNKIVLVT